MNKLIKTMALAAFALTFTVSVMAQKGKAYGKKFKADKAIAVTELSQKMGDQSKLENIVLVGEISEVCQAEGCWMKMKNETGEDVFIKFKDHAFLIPKDLAGHKAFVHGNAIKKTVSIEEQKHFAEDAEKSEEEIAKITQAKEELRVDGIGVIIE